MVPGGKQREPACKGNGWAKSGDATPENHRTSIRDSVNHLFGGKKQIFRPVKRIVLRPGDATGRDRSSGGSSRD
jgi:hypothetical protein